MKTLQKKPTRRPCHKRLEALNRAYLDALGEVMQATAWLDEVTETVKQAHGSLLNAEKLLQCRERKLTKADNAMTAYLNRFTP
jgi:hypothetical protein